MTILIQLLTTQGAYPACNLNHNVRVPLIESQNATRDTCSVLVLRSGSEVYGRVTYQLDACDSTTGSANCQFAIVVAGAPQFRRRHSRLLFNVACPNRDDCAR